MRSLAPVLLLLWMTGLLQGCSADGESPEDRIRDFIEAGVAAAEARSSSDLADLIHENYLDQKGYAKKSLTGLLRAYFLRHKNIHLFTKIDEIELLSDNQAVVRLHLAMAGSVISNVGALSAVRARLYRLELSLERDGEWLLRHAGWAPASITDLE